MKKNLAKLELISASAIFGTIGVFRKIVPLNSGMLCMFRGLIGAAFLFLVIFLKKERIAFKAVKNNLLYICVSGAAIGINWILCFESYNYTTVAISTLCYYMAPVFTIIASRFVFKESITKRNILCIAVAIAGMFLVSGIQSENTNPKQHIGILLSLAAAVLYSSDIVCNKKMHDIGPLDRTAFQLLIAGLVLIPYVAFVEEPAQFEMSAKIVLLVVILGIVHTGCAFFLMFDSLTSLDTKTVAFFTYIDPVLAVILSAVLLQEGITIQVAIGAVLIIGSALYNELKSN